MSGLGGIAAAPGRIAVVSHVHPSVSRGGAEISAYALFRGLLELGHDAIFVAACDEASRQRLLLEDEREFAVFHESGQYDHLYHAAMPRVVQDLMAILREQRVEVVNFHHFLFLGLDALDAAAAEPGLRTVLTLHEFLAICHHHGQMVTRPARALCERASAMACGDCFPEMWRMQHVLRRQRFQRILGRMDGFVSPSDFLAHRFVEWGLPAESIRVIENGLVHAAPAARPAPRHRDGARWVFGWFGQITEFKGADLLLRACEAIAREPELAERLRIDVHGVFVGQSGAFHEAFQRALRDYPFLAYRGAYTNAAAIGLMQQTDYVLMLSTWWENSPVVIQEAYEARRPVICPGIGGMAEKVRDGETGLHFRPGDPADFVRALRAAMEDGVHARLVAGLPKPPTARDMAGRYLDLLQPRDTAGARPARRHRQERA